MNCVITLKKKVLPDLQTTQLQCHAITDFTRILLHVVTANLHHNKNQYIILTDNMKKRISVKQEAHMLVCPTFSC